MTAKSDTVRSGTTPPPVEAGNRRQRGSNLLGVGQYNERLVLQLIRRAGSLPKAEIARLTRLSAQTVSVIINRLLREKLLIKQPRRREKGKVGQPAVPIALNPQGAYSIGIKIGRRSLDVLLIDFVGTVLSRRNYPYDYPDPDVVFPHIDAGIESLCADLTATQRGRIVGIGVAAPYSLGGWQQQTGAPREVLARWDRIDIRRRVGAGQSVPVWFANDATAACIAELEFGRGSCFNHYLYLFLGTFIGGGVVLNGLLHAGSYDNAGAVGSMPVPAVYADGGPATTGPAVQLIDCASRIVLERRLKAAGLEPEAAIAALGGGGGESTPQARAIFGAWLDRAAAAMAFAVTAATSVMDFEGVIIDGAFPAPLVERLTHRVHDRIRAMDTEGLVTPRLIPGSIGSDARALGGAILPLYTHFAPDREVLLKLGIEAVD